MTTTAEMTKTFEVTDSITALAEIDTLAWQIDRDGVESTPTDAIDHVLLIARDANTSPVLAEVLADTTAPPAVRERAFGLLAMQIFSSIDHSRLTLAA